MKPKELLHYKKYKPADSVNPLTLKWEYIENMTAHFWDCKPWEFRLETPEHQAEMMATYTVNNEIESYYNSEQLKKIKTQELKDKGGVTLGS